MGLKEGQKIKVNDEYVEPITKHKLWEQPGWTSGRIRRLIEAKQAEVKAKFEAQAKEAER